MKKLLLFVLLGLCAVSIAFGQESGKTTFFATPEACTSAKQEAVNVYEPVFSDHLAAWQKLKAAGQAELVENHGKTYCVDEWSIEGKVAGWHVIRWPANNPYFKNTDGQIADGRCGNKVRHIWEVPPPAPVPPPPATPPPTGLVHVKKLDFDPASGSMRFVTGSGHPFIGDHEVALNSDGEGEIRLPVGKYPVREEFDHAVWTQIYLSLSEVSVEAGKTVNIEIKNQQLRPPPQPMRVPDQPKTEVVTSGPPACLSNGSREVGFTFSAINGDGQLYLDGRPSPGSFVFPQDKPGLHTLEFRVTGPGGTTTCKRTWEVPAESEFTLEVPEFRKGRKFPIPCVPRERTKFGIIVPIAECVGLAFGAYEVYEVIVGGAVVISKVGAFVGTIVP